MPNIQVRQLSQAGIIKDAKPSSLPLGAWSDGRNVSFTDGKVSRAPVWKSVFGGLIPAPQFAVGYTPTSGIDEVVLACPDGSLARYKDQVVTQASQDGFVAGMGALQGSWTSTQLGDVIYVNHPSIRLRALKPSDARFAFDPQWDPSWRAGVIRQFQDTLIALNVTKGAAAIPSMVKVSDITYFGQTPQSWDSTDPTKLAYENELAQLDGPILDGLVRDQEFLFYTAHQTWSMQATGDFQYQFRKAFSNAGVLAPNCVTESGGLHYVFGSSDLYETDGSSQKSLADGRVRRWLFQVLDRRHTDRCFVQVVPQTNEVYFAFVSKDPSCAFAASTGCNMAIVHNIGTGVISIVDLPNVVSMIPANVETVPLWSTLGTKTWGDLGPSWASDAPTTARQVAGITGNELVALDPATDGQFAGPASTVLNAPAWVERTGMKFDDDVNGKSPLRGAKEWRSAILEAEVVGSGAFEVSLGSAMLADDAPVWDAPMSFDPKVDYAVDSTSSGRALAIRIEFPADVSASVSAIDMDVVPNGGR